MLRRLVVLMTLFAVLWVLGGCATNVSDIKPTRNWRRITIAGESARNTLEGFDRVLGTAQYPTDSLWLH